MFISVFIGDSIAMETGEVIQQMMHENMSQVHYIALNDIYGQQERLLNFIEEKLKEMGKDDFLAIHLSDNRDRWLRSVYKSFGGVSVPYLKLKTSQVAESEEMNKWIWSENRRLEEMLKNLISVIAEYNKQPYVLINVVLGPAFDLINHFYGNWKQKGLVNLEVGKLNIEVEEVLNKLLNDTLVYDSYLFGTERLCNRIMKKNPIIRCNSFQAEINNDIRYKHQIYGLENWLNGNIKLTEWEFLNEDGITAHPSLMKRMQPWFKKLYNRWCPVDRNEQLNELWVDGEKITWDDLKPLQQSQSIVPSTMDNRAGGKAAVNKMVEKLRKLEVSEEEEMEVVVGGMEKETPLVCRPSVIAPVTGYQKSCPSLWRMNNILEDELECVAKMEITGGRNALLDCINNYPSTTLYPTFGEVSTEGVEFSIVTKFPSVKVEEIKDDIDVLSNTFSLFYAIINKKYWNFNNDNNDKTIYFLNFCNVSAIEGVVYVPDYDTLREETGKRLTEARMVEKESLVKSYILLINIAMRYCYYAKVMNAKDAVKAADSFPAIAKIIDFTLGQIIEAVYHGKLTWIDLEKLNINFMKYIYYFNMARVNNNLMKLDKWG